MVAQLMVHMMDESAYLWGNEGRETSSGDVGHDLIQLVSWLVRQGFNCTYDSESAVQKVIWWSEVDVKLSS